MDGLSAVAILAVGGLVAWRWWLSHCAAQRKHELEVMALQRKHADDDVRLHTTELRVLKERVESLEWRTAAKK